MLAILASSSYTITNLIDGIDGKTPFWHTAYSNSADGKTDFSLTVSDGKRYMGQYTDYLSADSTDPTKYKWVNMVGSIEFGGVNLITGTTESYVYQGTTEFLRTVDLAPAIDKYGLVQYTLSFDAKVAVAGKVQVYMQNGSGSRYAGPLVKLAMSTEWKRYSITFTPTNSNLSLTQSLLAFYSPSGTGIIPSVKRIKMETGNIATDYSQAPEDIDAKIDTKADEEFTIEQLNLIAENQRLLKAENDAKASLEELNTWVNTIKEQLEAQKNGQRISEEALIEASTRVTQIQSKLGEIALVTEAITQYMSYSENGLIIGMKDGTSSVRVTTDRISFYSGGTETAFISQGFLQIESGVFTLRLQIGHYLFEEDANGMLMIGRVI